MNCEQLWGSNFFNYNFFLFIGHPTVTPHFFLNGCTDNCSLHYNVRGNEMMPLNVHGFAFSESLSPSCAVCWALKVALNLPVLCFKRHRSEQCSVVAKIKQDIKNGSHTFLATIQQQSSRYLSPLRKKQFPPQLRQTGTYLAGVCDEQSPWYKWHQRWEPGARASECKEIRKINWSKAIQTQFPWGYLIQLYILDILFSLNSCTLVSYRLIFQALLMTYTVQRINMIFFVTYQRTQSLNGSNSQGIFPFHC